MRALAAPPPRARGCPAGTPASWRAGVDKTGVAPRAGGAPPARGCGARAGSDPDVRGRARLRRGEAVPAAATVPAEASWGGDRGDAGALCCGCPRGRFSPRDSMRPPFGSGRVSRRRGFRQLCVRAPRASCCGSALPPGRPQSARDQGASKQAGATAGRCALATSARAGTRKHDEPRCRCCFPLPRARQPACRLRFRRAKTSQVSRRCVALVLLPASNWERLLVTFQHAGLCRAACT